MSQKINAIVFTRDNPAQLSLLLESIEKYAKDVFYVNIIVQCSGEDFHLGYKKLESKGGWDEIHYVQPEDNLREDSFKELVLGVLKNGSKNNLEYSCFFLDDDIIYNKVELDDITSQIKSDEDVVCFSLRLGDNTTKCYTLGAENVLHDIRYDGNFMKWDWSLHYLDFGYPFAMDGHVFRTRDIYKLVRKSRFTGVEELEMALFDFTETFPRNMMASYKTSALVGAPVGRVQQSIDNEITMRLKEAEARVRRENMNTVFLSGEFIKLENIDFSNIEGCHQKLDFGGLYDNAIKQGESSAMDRVANMRYKKRWDELTDEQREEIDTSLMKLNIEQKDLEKND